FLKLAALGTAGAVIGAPRADAEAKSLTLIHESSFIKTFDEYFQKTLAPAYEKATGVKVNYELASVGSLQTRVTTIAETGSGPDLTLNFFNWPFLYDEKYVDVSDIAEVVGKQQGGWYASAQEACVVNGKWKALPFGNVGQLMNWRIDWFKEVGFDKFPDTWDELLEAGTKLKAKGHPFGFELGHGFGDNHGWIYPLMWSHGAHEVEPDGKTVVIDSDETARALDFARKFYQQTMLEDVLGWTDPSNNKAWLSEQISCTNNAESILWVAKRDFPEIGKVTGQALNPQGPKGRFHLLNSWSHAIFTHTPDKEAARAFLRWLMDAKQLSAWYASADTYYQPFLHGYDKAPMWNVEPRNLPYRDAMASAHLPGWPAPVSRVQSQVIAKYVVVDMFAKACSGGSTKDVIKSAETQIKQIYQQT
ncbi:MAG: ABC transporter substrate-binding protein, partial [Acidimicrobiales bacterium]